MKLTMLEISEPGMLDPGKFDGWQRERISTSTFEELYDEAAPTLQPGVRYHSSCGLWLELSGTIQLSEVDTYPEDSRRLWRQGRYAFSFGQPIQPLPCSCLPSLPVSPNCKVHGRAASAKSLPKGDRCPSCGYTKEDAQIHCDHYLCKNAGHAPWEGQE